MDRRQFLAGLSALAASNTVRAATGPVNKVSTRLLRLKVSDGTWIAVEEGGNGPSLLLVHGSGSLRKAWGRVAPLLESQFHTYAMDRRGHGDSTDGAAYTRLLVKQKMLFKSPHSFLNPSSRSVTPTVGS
jgi:hypothetical protein